MNTETICSAGLHPSSWGGSTEIGDAASAFVFTPVASLEEELVLPGNGSQFSFIRKNVKLLQHLEELLGAR